ncbi:MAG: branched-chain-amino-acid transaminase [Nitrospirota bacterium]
MYVYVNGKLVLRKEAVISVFDHGFLYGDGIFETMRVYDGVIFKLDEHIQRLCRSASLIGLSIPIKSDALKISIYETLIANNLRDAYVRLTVSRGQGSIGLDPALCTEPSIIIIAEKLREYPRTFYQNGISIIIAGTKRNLKEAINPQIKSLNFLNSILAKIEAIKSGVYEALMLNVNEEITEGTISNVFFYREGVLCTPSLECGILDGITRNTVLDIALREDLRVREDRFFREDIYTAEEVFITNTTLEVLPVSMVDGRRYKVGRITRLLRSIYKEEVHAYVTDVKAAEPSLWGQYT